MAQFLETIVFDLMDTFDGVKIAEIQSAISGYKGWEKKLGRGSMHARILDGMRSLRTAEQPQAFHIFTAMQFNKTLAASLLGPLSEQLWPRQNVYASLPFADAAWDVTSNFADCPMVVFKTPYDIKGEGVFMVDPATLKKRLMHGRKMLGKIEQFLIPDEKTTYGRMAAPYRPCYVVQQAVKARPVEVAKRAFGVPATRLVASVRVDDRGAEWVFHGAYHKMPGKMFSSFEDAADPQFKNRRRDFLVSRISEKGNGAFALAQDRYEDICAQIRAGMSDALDVVRQTPDKDWVLQALSSSNMGTRMAMARHLVRFETLYLDMDEKDRDRAIDLLENLLADNGFFYHEISHLHAPWLRRLCESETAKKAIEVLVPSPPLAV